MRNVRARTQAGIEEETMEEGSQIRECLCSVSSLHSQDSLPRKQCCSQPTAAYIIKTVNTDGHRPTHRQLDTWDFSGASRLCQTDSWGSLRQSPFGRKVVSSALLDPNHTLLGESGNRAQTPSIEEEPDSSDPSRSSADFVCPDFGASHFYSKPYPEN